VLLSFLCLAVSKYVLVVFKGGGEGYRVVVLRLPFLRDGRRVGIVLLRVGIVGSVVRRKQGRIERTVEELLRLG
jgi:hypothetical protein